MNSLTNYGENRDRKFVLTLAGTYGRERQPGATVTLVVTYDRLSQTLQQIHRKGGKVLSIVSSTSVLALKTQQPASAPAPLPKAIVSPPLVPPPEPVFRGGSPSSPEKSSPMSPRKLDTPSARSRTRDFWLTPFQIYEKFGVMGSLKKRSQNRLFPLPGAHSLRTQRQNRSRPHRRGVRFLSA